MDYHGKCRLGFLRLCCHYRHNVSPLFTGRNIGSRATTLSKNAIMCGRSSVVERNVANVDVVGPNPIARLTPPADRSWLEAFFLVCPAGHTKKTDSPVSRTVRRPGIPSPLIIIAPKVLGVNVRLETIWRDRCSAGMLTGQERRNRRDGRHVGSGPEAADRISVCQPRVAIVLR